MWHHIGAVDFENQQKDSYKPYSTDKKSFLPTRPAQYLLMEDAVERAWGWHGLPNDIVIKSFHHD